MPKDRATPTESAELTCLFALRGARARLFTSMAGHAAEHAPDKRRDGGGGLARDYLGLVRSDGAAQIAEFYFVLEELGLADGARFRPYLERHNAAMLAYLDAPDRMRAIGLTPQRVKAAMFSADQMDFVAFVSPPGRLLLDQSSLGRLLTEVMAPESCRRIVVALAEGGLLTRRMVGQALIESTGVLEGLFRAHLSEVVGSLRGSA